MDEEGCQCLRGALSNRSNDLVGDIVTEPIHDENAEKLCGYVIAPFLVVDEIFFSGALVYGTLAHVVDQNE